MDETIFRKKENHLRQTLYTRGDPAYAFPASLTVEISDIHK